MNVGELKALLEGVDDNLQILIPVTHEFDGRFYSPCKIESGKSTCGLDSELTEEDIEEMELLNKPIPEEDCFLLLPCSFGEELDKSHELN